VINRELEAFSYSVSHDLRAPLRSIEGFSRIMLEDYSSRLDPEGVENLNTIRAATQRMSLLIEDMLRLSRVTRTELHQATVDMSDLTAAVDADLRKEFPSRAVEFVNQPGLVAEADASLMRVVLQNLLGNSWKFTGRLPVARVEFGRTVTNEGEAFYVRDNGVGFDPAHASKLFVAFQRLHPHTDFPGTGIGLATVQRIVHRHGGRIWAESAPGRGTTIFFTIPPAPKDDHAT
jgi:signal transduction histidine kinase